jgi:hypothetical protein
MARASHLAVAGWTGKAASQDRDASARFTARRRETTTQVVNPDRPAKKSVCRWIQICVDAADPRSAHNKNNTTAAQQAISARMNGD